MPTEIARPIVASERSSVEYGTAGLCVEIIDFGKTQTELVRECYSSKPDTGRLRGLRYRGMSFRDEEIEVSPENEETKDMQCNRAE